MEGEIKIKPKFEPFTPDTIINGVNSLTVKKSYAIDLSKPPPPLHPLLTINGTIIASPGNIILIKGFAKAEKSFCSALFCSAFISEYPILNIEAEPIEGRLKIVFIDTEQSLPHTHIFARRVHRLAGYRTDRNHPNFEVHYLKELNTQQRFDVLREVAKDSMTGVIILDGAVDIISDFNDLKESTKVRDELMQMVAANNIALIAVIHTNKRDANSRGHFGAMLEQKSETTIQLSKDENVFTVAAAYTRNMPFDELRFIIDDNGLPQLIENFNKKEIESMKQQENFTLLLSGQKLMDYKELVKEYSELSGLSEPTAKRHISKAIKNKLLMKISGSYTLNKFNE